MENFPLFEYGERTARLHRGVDTSIEAARRVSGIAASDAFFVLKLIHDHGGLTYKEVNRLNPDQRDLQPRLSCLKTDGYIAPQIENGSPVKRERCAVMVWHHDGTSRITGRL